METGFIKTWRIASPADNRIMVCSGDSAGDVVGFRIEDCCKALADELRKANINGPSSCPPPEGTTILKFRLGFSDGEFRALDICFA